MATIRKYGLLGAGILLILGALIVGVATAATLPVSAGGNQANRSGTGNITAGNNGNTGSSGNTASNSITNTYGYGYSNGNGYGGMMGNGHMGTSMGMGMGGDGMMGGNGSPANPNAQRLSGDQVRKAVGDYLNRYYNGQGLTIEEIMEFQNNFYAQIKESAPGINAFELLIDPYTGNVWPEYGPNMMWNTKYGHMAQSAGGGMDMMGRGMMGGNGMMGGYNGYAQPNQPGQPTANMPVTAQQAVQDAQQYLDAQGTGLTAEGQPDTFYGYYTVHALKNGNVVGMLSVNGYTGQVWYHTWHGTFIGMVGN